MTFEGDPKMTISRVLLAITMLLAFARCGSSSAGPEDQVEPVHDVADANLESETVGQTDNLAMDAASEIVAPDETNAIFAADRLVQIEIEIDPEDWELLRAEGRGLATLFSGCQEDYEYTYFPATVTVDGVTIESAGLRKKGYLGSLSVLRPSLKVHFGKYKKDQTYFGVKRLTLNNDRQDPSHTHQVMSYAMFRNAGVPAPRCNLAHVTVNGVDLGTYSNVESIKKPFLSRWFEDNDGNLYEGQIADFMSSLVDKFQRKTNKTSPDGGEPDRSDLDAIVEALDADDDQLLDRLTAVIDLDSFLTFWAVEVITGHWDGYSGNRNNFYTYHDPTSDLFHFIPWGTDGAFAVAHAFLPMTPASVYALGKLSNRLYNLPAGRTMYHDRLKEVLGKVWNQQALLEEVDRIGKLANSPEDYLQVQKDYINWKAEAIWAELPAGGPTWLFTPKDEEQECRTPLEISGTFDAFWNDDDEYIGGAGITLDIEDEEEPLAFLALYNTAGPPRDDETGDSGVARVTLIGVLEDGATLIVSLWMPEQLWQVGEVPMHGLETLGMVFYVEKKDAPPILVGYVGDGFITFDKAGNQPGDDVKGAFTGLLSQ